MDLSSNSTPVGASVLRVSAVEDLRNAAQEPVNETPLIFVTGASRSGTTMLARMLGAHSAILAFNELHYFGSLWDPHDSSRAFSARNLSELAALLLARQNHGLWGGRPSAVESSWGRRLVRDMAEDQCNPAGLFNAFAHRLTADAGKTFACEQTPRNIFYARRLLELYPNAKVVHMVRDPRAVLASQKNRWRLRQLGAQHLPIAEMLRNRVNYHPLTMGRLWSRATEEACQLKQHSRFSIVRFEDMATDSEAAARRLCGFLGLAFEKEMLEIPRWGSSNVEHTSARTGVSAEVVDQWRSTLSRGEALICEKITNPLMQRFGYKPEYLGHQGLHTTIPSMLSYPLHVAGVVAMNPRRALIQLRAMTRGKSG